MISIMLSKDNKVFQNKVCFQGEQILSFKIWPLLDW